MESNCLDMYDIVLHCNYIQIVGVIHSLFIYLELPANSYRIACTNIQNFEEGEICASTISVDHTFGSDMNLFGYDMILFGSDLILFGSNFEFQEPLVMLVAGLINFGVTN